MNSQYSNQISVPGVENSAPGTLKGHDETQMQKSDVLLHFSHLQFFSVPYKIFAHSR